MEANARILCCPANPHPAAMKALEKYAPQTEIVPLDSDDVYGYWREIRKRWTGKQALIIIEQDIEIGPGTVASLEHCSQPWCVFAYPIARGKVLIRHGLGCTKISESAQQLAPAERIKQGFTLCRDCRGRGCWWHLDCQIAQVLRGRGLEPHVHGNVIHHHDYPNAPQYLLLFELAATLGAQLPQATSTDESWGIPWQPPPAF